MIVSWDPWRCDPRGWRRLPKREAVGNRLAGTASKRHDWDTSPPAARPPGRAHRRLHRRRRRPRRPGPPPEPFPAGGLRLVAFDTCADALADLKRAAKAHAEPSGIFAVAAVRA